ncbi:MAG TPA: cytidylate kinase-like family protein [Isosphaeraceae bacterium]|jgi:cytidylate kinase|nr:cytidylate kinase-like family protein [Isosphaeraceae bacterium]
MASPEVFLPSDSTGSSHLLRWPATLARWLLGRRRGPQEPTVPPEPVPRFRNVCISREAGAGGGLIGRLLGTRLNWKVYNHEIVEIIAQRMEVTTDVVQALDELAPGVVQDWLLPLREEHYAPQEAYLDHLAKLIEAIGHARESIIVGRGANFLLPREETLCVRVIAPLKERAKHLAEQMGVSLRTARRAARDLDNRRLKFARTMYRVNASDPHYYDLVLDSASLGIPIAVEVLVRAVEAGMPPSPPSEPKADPGLGLELGAGG